MKALGAGRGVNRQRGLSLIELFVALVLGLVVVGGALAYHLAGLRASRHTEALARMTEDAQVALALIGRDIRLAGTAQVSGMSPTGQFVTPLGFPAVRGCDKGFAAGTPGARPATADVLAEATTTLCATTGTQSSALEVNFLASTDVLPLVSGQPSDCRGAAIVERNVAWNGATDRGRYTSHRYYVGDPSGPNPVSLYCATPGDTQPLVPNVKAMRLRYGESPNWSASDPATHRVQRWVKASDVVHWNQVIAVEVCLLMQSDEPVLSQEDTWTYLDCDDASKTSADRRLYRAYRSTQLVRNRGAW